MTLSTANTRVETFPGAGLTGPFTFDFQILDSTHITVTHFASDGTETIYTASGGDFTISLINNGRNGGKITLATALAVGETLVIEGATPLDQVSQYSNQGAFFGQRHEDSYDKLTQIVQEQALKINNSLKISNAVAGSYNLVITDAPVDGRVLQFSGLTGKIIAGPSSTEISNAQGYATAASNSANAAATSASDAAATLAQVQAVYDNFDDRYLGSKTSDPSVDNDGDPLTDGALYFNTTSNLMRIYDLGGASWNDVTTALLDGSVTTAKLATNAVTNAKAAQMPANTIKINNTGATADQKDGTIAEVLAMLSVYTQAQVDAAISAMQSTINATLFGVGQTWQDLSASRVGNTAYQNTTGKPIMVVIATPNANGLCQTSSDGVTWVDTAYATGGGAISNATFVVPDGWYYRHNAASTSYQTWSELR